MQFVVENFPSPSGPLRFACVPWDREVYGFPFFQLIPGETRLRDLEQQLAPWLGQLNEGRGPCLVYAKVSTTDVDRMAVLTAQGFRVVECLAQMRLPLAGLPSVPFPATEAFRVRLATSQDLPRLMDIAGTAFLADRMHMDKRLSPERADLRMRRWVERSVLSGDRVQVCERPGEGTIDAFFVFRRLNQETWQGSLAAVAPEAQMSTGAPEMWRASFRWLYEQGGEWLHSDISLNNLNSLNLYIHLGGRFRDLQATLHWYRGDV